MPAHDPPRGQRFSQVYLLRGEPAQDSARMRHRIGALIYEFDTLKDQLAGAVNRELGIPAPYPTHSEIKITKKAGDPQSGRIRCVCAPCNNGWMSVRQSETKPILIPLLRGESFSLHRRAQTTLAAWIAMFTMVAEFLDQTGTR